MTMHDQDLETADLLNAGKQSADLEQRSGDGDSMSERSSTDDERNVDIRSHSDSGVDDDGEALFATEDRRSFDQRWTEVQTRFVDNPRDAVASADHLVAEVMQTLAGRFADHKAALEEQWSGGGEVETEQLRQAMRSYRTFFRRLLAA